jgi:hypothetical protein
MAAEREVETEGQAKKFNELQSLHETVLEERDTLMKSVSDLRSEMESTLTDLRDLRDKCSALEAKSNLLESELDSARDRLLDVEVEKEMSAERLSYEQEKLEAKERELAALAVELNKLKTKSEATAAAIATVRRGSKQLSSRASPATVIDESEPAEVIVKLKEDNNRLTADKQALELETRRLQNQASEDKLRMSRLEQTVNALEGRSTDLELERDKQRVKLAHHRFGSNRTSSGRNMSATLDWQGSGGKLQHKAGGVGSSSESEEDEGASDVLFLNEFDAARTWEDGTSETRRVEPESAVRRLGKAYSRFGPTMTSGLQSSSRHGSSRRNSLKSAAGGASGHSFKDPSPSHLNEKQSSTGVSGTGTGGGPGGDISRVQSLDTYDEVDSSSSSSDDDVDLTNFLPDITLVPAAGSDKEESDVENGLGKKLRGRGTGGGGDGDSDGTGTDSDGDDLALFTT